MSYTPLEQMKIAEKVLRWKLGEIEISKNEFNEFLDFYEWQEKYEICHTIVEISKNRNLELK